MKIITLLLLTLTLTLFAESKPIMLKVLTKINLNETTTKTFRAGVEMSLTKNNYSLIDEATQEEALKEQRSEVEDDCIDDSCLMDTGKMLAARYIFIVDITELEKGKKYLFKARLIDLETNETKRSSSKLYNDSLFNADSLFKFSQELTNTGLGIETRSQQLVEISDSIKIVINSEPKGAKVHIDGKFAGKTPAQARIAKGKHKIKVFADKYQNYLIDDEFYIDKTINAKLKARIDEIEIKSNPSDAEIYYRGRLLGKTPYKFKISATEKDRKITLKKEGFRIDSISVSASENLSLSVTLIPLSKHKITINTHPSYAKIELSNSYGTKFILKSGEEKELFEGKYKISVSDKNYSSPSDMIREIDLNKDLSLNVKMIADYNRFFKTFSAFDITAGDGYQYMSAGAGIDIINSVTNIRKFTFGGIFYHNITDSYNHADIYMEYKFELFNNFDMGITSSYLVLLPSDKRNETVSGFFSGGVIEYSYFIVKELFISAKLKAGASYFMVDDAYVQYYILGGIHLGYSGF